MNVYFLGRRWSWQLLMWTCMVEEGKELYRPINECRIWIDKPSGQCLLEMHIINLQGATLLLIKLYRLSEPWYTNMEASRRLLKIERSKQKRALPQHIHIVTQESFFSIHKVRRERWPETSIPAGLCVVAGCRLCVQQNTYTSKWCHDEGDTAVLADGNTRWGTPSLPGGPRCVLLLQLKLQIHIKYISQERSQLKCKPCWVWKSF